MLQWWSREGRERRLFFAQREAAETIIFLTEARADFRQGIAVPRDDPSDTEKAEGYAGFLRYACKMATGSGKTTVMGMLAAWSILNKVNDRSDARFSDVVLIVCPNVTIRDRLRELDPEGGDASLYRTRDLVPPHLMTLLSQGKIIVTNWHVFEPQAVDTGGVNAKVSKAGVVERTGEDHHQQQDDNSARIALHDADGSRCERGLGVIVVLKEERDGSGTLKKGLWIGPRRVESDTALVNRIIGREAGGKQNILVMNDEAHHAYRIKREDAGGGRQPLLKMSSKTKTRPKTSSRKRRSGSTGSTGSRSSGGSMSASTCRRRRTFSGASGKTTNRPFPWVVSDFGLIDAIESGLVKIPQLAVRDTTGAAIPGYFNIWQWILPKLTPAERGGKRANPKPEAILKWAHTPIAMLGGLWETTIDGMGAGRRAPPAGVHPRLQEHGDRQGHL